MRRYRGSLISSKLSPAQCTVQCDIKCDIIVTLFQVRHTVVTRDELHDYTSLLWSHGFWLRASQRQNQILVIPKTEYVSSV